MICSKYILAVLILISMLIVEYNSYNINKANENSIRRRDFFEIIDQFETLETNVTMISETDKKLLLKRLDRGLPMTAVESYVDKTASLECAYDFAALCMLYHIKQMVDKKNVRSNHIRYTLSQYSKYLHRSLLITYMLRGPVSRTAWYVAVYIDAVYNEFDRFNDKTFFWIVDKFKYTLSSCHNKLDERHVLPEDISTANLYGPNTELLSKLGLTMNASHLFGSEDRFDVYRFFFSTDNVNEKFAPPKVWFETHKNLVLKGHYSTVKYTWKTNFFALCDYTDTVKDLVLMTAYYALLKHCRFLLITWYILVDRVNLSDPGLRPGMREERKKLMQMPLPLLETIFRDLNSGMDIRNLPNIEANLNNDEHANKTKFKGFVVQVLAMYNLYAHKVGTGQLDYNVWLGSFKIQNQFLYENSNVPSFQAVLMEHVKILQTYYDRVVATLKPTDFAAIEYLSAAANNRLSNSQSMEISNE